jgi:hypothetical protein
MANLIQADPLNAHRFRHQDFSAFYRDETLDPCHRSYERIMERFDPEVNATSHVTLLDQAVASGPVPQAYLCCIRPSPIALCWSARWPSYALGWVEFCLHRRGRSRADRHGDASR